MFISFAKEVANIEEVALFLAKTSNSSRWDEKFVLNNTPGQISHNYKLHYQNF